MTRSAHLAWAKERAIAFVNADNLPAAVSSMVSDLAKHPETAMLAGRNARPGTAILLNGPTPERVRLWIEGIE